MNEWLQQTIALRVSSIASGAAHRDQGEIGIFMAGYTGSGTGVRYPPGERDVWFTILTKGVNDSVVCGLVCLGINPDVGGQVKYLEAYVAGMFYVIDIAIE